jgi:hypothetical protein
MRENKIADGLTLFTYGKAYDSQRDQAVQDATVKAECT